MTINEILALVAGWVGGAVALLAVKQGAVGDPAALLLCLLCSAVPTLVTLRYSRHSRLKIDPSR